MERYSVAKQEWITKPHKLHLAKCKEAAWKATYCVIPFLWYSGKGKNTGGKNRGKKSVIARGSGGKESWTGKAQGIFWAMEGTIVLDTVMAYTWHYAFVKPIELYSPESEP